MSYEIYCNNCNKIRWFSLDVSLNGIHIPFCDITIRCGSCGKIKEIHIPVHIPTEQILKYLRQYLVKDALENYRHEKNRFG